MAAIGILVLVLLASSQPAHAARSCRRTAEVHVYKGSGELVLRCQNKERLRVPVTFGAQPTGHKKRSGDERTPEGRYTICTKHRSKRHYKFIGLSYPNGADAAAAARAGLISRKQHKAIQQAHRRGRCPPWRTPLGGAIGIHGIRPDLSWMVPLWNKLSRGGGLYRHFGLTDGCIATDNASIDRLWTLVDVGTPVYIHPTD